MPLYDLVCEILATFKVFATHPEEEASLVTLLEAVKEFEQAGMNTLRNFIEYAEQEDDVGAWKIDVPASADAVQVLTVHKAKGLGFPVVIAVLHDHYIKTDNWALVDNGQGDGRMEILHLNAGYAEKSDLLKKLYDAARFKETVDELNQLYVALTRAREEMYVIGLYKKEPKFPTKYIPVDGFLSGARPAVSRPALGPRQELKTFYTERRRVIPVQESNRLASREARRGDVVHAVLSRLEFIERGFEESLYASIVDARAEFHYEGDAKELEQTILNFLTVSGIGHFFERCPDRVVLNEQEFASGTGALYRADRIVIDPDVITVIDFKTGGDEGEPKYIPQVLQYMGMTGEVFSGKPLHGYLAYVDLKELRRVQ
jgi:ATP-dependent exoDNAse (exonuclease V) beta subunit